MDIQIHFYALRLVLDRRHSRRGEGNQRVLHHQREKFTRVELPVGGSWKGRALDK